jgi:uncharacterized protein (DUF885 family)
LWNAEESTYLEDKMKRWKKITLSVACCLLVALAVLLVPTIWGKPWSIEHFYARVFLEHMLDHPQLLSYLRIVEPMGLDFHNDDLDDYSVAGTRRDLQRAADNLQMLHRYDREKLQDQLSYDVLEWFIADAVKGAECAFHSYPVNQSSGVQSGLIDFMISTHRIDSENDARNYLARLGKLGVAVDQIIESLQYREELGIVPPRFVMTHVLREMRELISPSTAENVLCSHLAEDLDKLDGLDESTRQELLDEAAHLVKEVVYPAFQRLIDHYAALEPTASTDDGFWKLPNGDACYAQRLRQFTTTSMTPEQVHQVGLQEVTRLRGEMRAILEQLGRDSEDLGTALQALNHDPQMLYPNTDEGRQQILTDYQAIIDEIGAELDSILVKRPAAKVEVKRVPEFMQATAPGAYYSLPAMDGSRPGIFYVNLRNVAEIPKHGMRTLAYHEAIPGHHLQHAVAQELEGAPFFRRVIPFTAYGEGWALYAEQVAAELGFQDDPYDRLGYLTAQMFRATRLVVDTGIHQQRWTRQQAIDYMLANTGMPEPDVVAEVERYIVNPGQACAYMIGFLEIMRLREDARAALGDSFDLREFNQKLLEQGALPLALLRREIEQWLRAEQDRLSGAES